MCLESRRCNRTRERDGSSGALLFLSRPLFATAAMGLREARDPGDFSNPRITLCNPWPVRRNDAVQAGRQGGGPTRHVHLCNVHPLRGTVPLALLGAVPLAIRRMCAAILSPVAAISFAPALLRLPLVLLVVRVGQAFCSLPPSAALALASWCRTIGLPWDLRTSLEDVITCGALPGFHRPLSVRGTFGECRMRYSPRHIRQAGRRFSTEIQSAASSKNSSWSWWSATLADPLQRAPLLSAGNKVGIPQTDQCVAGCSGFSGRGSGRPITASPWSPIRPNAERMRSK